VPRFAERCGFASAVAGHSVRNCGGATRFDRQCYMMLVTPGGALHHELAWVASEQHLPSECGALLSLDALVRIGVDMNWHGAQSAVARPGECIPRLRVLLSQKFPRSFAKETDKVSSVLVSAAPLDSPADLCEAVDDAGSSFEVHLSETQFKIYNDRTNGKVFEKPFSHLQVDVNPDLPGAVQEEYRRIIADFKNVFAPHSGEPPVLSAAEPYKILLKQGYKPRFCPKPRWPPEQHEYWRRWAEEALAGGGWTFSKGCWASRPHAVFKQGTGGKHVDLSFFRVPAWWNPNRKWRYEE
jgi:hypothetical protein